MTEYSRRITLLHVHFLQVQMCLPKYILNKQNIQMEAFFPEPGKDLMLDKFDARQTWVQTLPVQLGVVCNFLGLS